MIISCVAPRALSGQLARTSPRSFPLLPSQPALQPLKPSTASRPASRQPLCASGSRQQGPSSSSRRPAAPAPLRAAASIDLPVEPPLSSLALEEEDSGLLAAVSGAALALWPRWAVNLLLNHSQQVRAFWIMARPINVLPSFVLVLLGAWVRAGGQGHTPL